jgi:hypothetical protein
MYRTVVVATFALAARPAFADPDPDAPPPGRHEDASLGTIFRGPFQSSRLFAMPVADVVGAYVMSLSGDGSLLQQTGLLTSAGVMAIGFGDIAQLEYRHTEAISVENLEAPVPSVGVQLKLPIPDRSGIPAVGVAFRLGVPRREEFGATHLDETVTDLYLVARLRFASLSWLTLHGGVRASTAKIELSGDRTFKSDRKLVLPTGGWEVAMNKTAKLVGEAALAPQFNWTPGGTADPTIGYGLLGRLGLRWSIFPALTLDGSIGYQLEVANARPASGLDAVVQWDIRLGAEVFVPWGALACRAFGAFCD